MKNETVALYVDWLHSKKIKPTKAEVTATATTLF